MTPLVSVIIPSYNPQEYLLDALASVFAQTHEAFEVLLVNDGSSTEYDTIFAEAKKRYPTLILLENRPNKGVAHARNIGAYHARGDYLSFLDQDDLWAPEKLALQSTTLDAHADIDYVTSRQRYFLAEGVSAAPSWIKPSQLDASLPGFLPGTLMVRKSAFRKLGGFDETLKAGTDDVDWFFRAGAMGLKTVELPHELLHKRIHQKNLSVQALAHNKELLSVVKMNMQRKKSASQISVIIPCYNGKKYIADTLRTVLAQGDAIGEILVIDDASTDGSAEFVASLNIQKLALTRLETNSGIGAARNTGISLAKFPTIAFLDADDLWTGDRTEKLLAALAAKQVPWAFGAIEHFVSEDCADGEKYALPPTQTGYFASSMLVSTAFMKQVGMFNESLRVGEFIDWFDRARALAPAPALVESVVLKRRIHGANSSLLAGNKNARDYLKVARDAIARKKQAS